MEEYLKLAHQRRGEKEQAEKVPVANMALRLTCLQNHCSSAGNKGFVCRTHWQRATHSIIVGGKKNVSVMKH